MLFNLPSQHLNVLAHHINKPICFTLIVLDLEEIFRYYRERLMAAQKIERNWLVYQRKRKQFNPKFTMTLISNNTPTIPGRDFGTWRRIQIIKFDYPSHAHDSSDNNDQTSSQMPELV